MRQLIAAIVEIALHRRGPDYLPSSGFLLAALFVVYLLVGAVVLRAGASLDGRAAAGVVVDSLLYLGYCWIVLKTFGRQRRFKQTASALLGVDALISLLGIPVLALNGMMQSSESLATVPLLLFYVLFFWSIDVAGFIMSRAIERPYIIGVLVVVAYVIGAMIVRESLSTAGS